jgi:hypothetical protein
MSMPEPKYIAAIPTEYNGVLYRSRLEARWAVTFDLLKWDIEYEPIDLRGWIPDFLYSGSELKEDEESAYIEIKYRTEMESAKKQIINGRHPPDRTIYLLGEKFTDFQLSPEESLPTNGFYWDYRKKRWEILLWTKKGAERIKTAFLKAGNIVQWKRPRKPVTELEFPIPDILEWAKSVPAEFIPTQGPRVRDCADLRDYIESLFSICAIEMAQDAACPDRHSNKYGRRISRNPNRQIKDRCDAVSIKL